ncbi:helix-turn-helix domain-containing protein [Lentzea sp. NPDC003310]|uniref:helix-turn-helix domain-containing protein n=1 Tax=Lentzea sp. NPDC003310 TaxID=3154447 RepID=UPI00339E734D
MNNPVEGAQTAIDEARLPADIPTGETVQVLFTPGQAARLLQVRESWLRRRAARRTIPCSFLGKHLRFSRNDIEKIAAAAEQPTKSTRIEIRTSLTSNRRRSGRNEHI